jgi:hypothetical protein
MMRLLVTCLACVGVGIGIGWTWRDVITPPAGTLNATANASAMAVATAGNGATALPEAAVAPPAAAAMTADRSEDARPPPRELTFDLTPSGDATVRRAAVIDLSSKLLADEQAGSSAIHDDAMGWCALDLYRALGHPDQLLCGDGYVSWCYHGDEHHDGVAFTFWPSQVAAVGRWVGR